MKLTYTIALTIIITMIIILPQVRIVATNLLMVKAVTNNLEVSHNVTEAKDLNIINISFRIIDFSTAHLVLYVMVLIIPLSTATKESMT